MATPRKVWRFQCDVALDEKDPMVTVFTGPIIPKDDGTSFVFQDTSNPAQIKLSALATVGDLIDSVKMSALRKPEGKP